MEDHFSAFCLRLCTWQALCICSIYYKISIIVSFTLGRLSQLPQIDWLAVLFR